MSSFQYFNASHSPDQLDRRRDRLRRGGALCSSRSAISGADALLEEPIFDVGAGKQATLLEHLLARLEQHGLRRCLCSEEAASVYTTAFGVERGREGEAMEEEEDEDVVSGAGDRDPHYYLCVPCELRLTAVSDAPASLRMLQDVHHHFSSAAHRRNASWMADADIDATLDTSPLVDVDSGLYTRIHVNGIPVLLSRRPGGGDMFYFLPHEQPQQQHGGAQRSRPHLAQREGDADEAIVPPGSDPSAVYWYRPLRSLFTRSKQLPLQGTTVRRFGAHKRGAISMKIRRKPELRKVLCPLHIPLNAYRDETLLDARKAPLLPALMPLRARRMLKCDLLAHLRTSTTPAPSATDGTRRLAYVQPEEPIAVWDEEVDAMGGSALDRCVVTGESAYRVVLLSDEQMARQLRTANSPVMTDDNMHGPSPLRDMPTATLTQELLSQIPTAPRLSAAVRSDVGSGTLTTSHPSLSTGSRHSDGEWE